MAARTVQLVSQLSAGVSNPTGSALARVTRVVRRIERHPDSGLALGSLAQEAGLSPYHFLRAFQSVTGITPHQYVRRARLRAAATRLTIEGAKVLDVALDSGFGDLSAFNRAFRWEFGVSPRAYRRLRHVSF
jgi:AraC-like DNA-binding protein